MGLQEFVEAAKPLGLLGIKIHQEGSRQEQWLLEGECRRNIYSASKSFTSCAVGFAIQEGLISLDERLVDAFAGDMPENISGPLCRAVVRDLLTICIGQECGSLLV